MEKYGAFVNALLSLFLFFEMASLTGPVAATRFGRDLQCDTDKSRTALDKCLRKGEKFVSRYLASIRRGRKTFDKCEVFTKFHQCLSSALLDCRPMKPQVEERWGPIMREFECTCNGSLACTDRLECYEGQYGGVLARRCDAYYRFNVQQKTRDRCRFIEENLSCKQALIESGCGRISRNFAFHMSWISLHKTIKSARCHINALAGDYAGFTFSQNCPTNLATRLDDCHSKHLRSRQRLSFHEDNDLIVTGTEADVGKACKNYNDYTDCTSPIQERCPKGTDMYLQHESHIRVYLMKIAYICGKASRAFSSNIECYKEVLNQKMLNECDYIYVALKPVLQKVTAFQFYCKQEEADSIRLRQHLDQLRSCYEDVFLRACNESGARAMNGLIREVFDDPFYLRYKYKPDCSLHSAVDATTPKHRTGNNRLVATTSTGCKPDSPVLNHPLLYSLIAMMAVLATHVFRIRGK